MKKIALLIWAIVAIVSIGLAQDNIVLRTGEEVKAKVEEVGLTEVKYKRADNHTGPLYSVLKSDVLMIKYENGTKDVFATAAPATPVPATAATPPAVPGCAGKSLSYNGDYNRLRKAGNKRIVLGSVLTGLSAPILFTGIGMTATGLIDLNADYNGYSDMSAAPRLVGGMILTAIGTAALVTGPILISKGVKMRRMARSAQQQPVSMGFSPIRDYNLERYGRAFNQQPIGTLSFTF